MDALDRILPLASLLWPVLDCDVSISRDPATGDATYRARVFDVDHPAGLAAKPLAEGTAGTPSDAAEALASHLATLARPRLDVLLRAAGYPTPDASTRADLAADVARLERAVADLTRECDAAHIARGERDGLRVELDAAREEIRARASAIGALAAGHAPDFAALADRLDGCALHALRRIAERLDDQAAHRAAGEGVDLRRYVLRADVVAALGTLAATLRTDGRAARASGAKGNGAESYVRALGVDSAIVAVASLAPVDSGLGGNGVEHGAEHGDEGRVTVCAAARVGTIGSRYRSVRLVSPDGVTAAVLYGEAIEAIGGAGTIGRLVWERSEGHERTVASADSDRKARAT